MPRLIILLSILALASLGCTAEEAKQTAKAAAEKSAELAKEGAQLAKEGYEASKPALEKGAELAKEGAVKGAELAKEGYEASKPALDKAGAAVVAGVDTAVEKGVELAKEGYEASKPTLHVGYVAAVDGLTTAAEHTKSFSGSLTASSWTWLQAQAAKNESISSIIAHGKQVSGAASEIYTILDAAIDSDTDIEIIYQPIEGDTANTDRAIQAMPRVEVIDGLQVGFQDMTGYQGTSRVNESAYMVVWRQGDKLVGFIYRSHSGIKIDLLVKEAPRLITLARSVGRAVIPAFKSGKPTDGDVIDPPAVGATPDATP
jgi:hypothetical protein